MIKIIKDIYTKYALYFKYIISAGISFVLDIVLYSIFLLILEKKVSQSIIIATFLARAISSLVNYLMNKHKVFNYKKESKDNTLSQYFGLVIINVTLSAVIVSYLSSIFHIYSTFIKIVIDILIFISNFFIQKKFIFNNNKNNKITRFILPIVCFIAIFIKIDEIKIIFNYNLLDFFNMLIWSLIIFYLFKNNYYQKDKKILNIFSLIMSILMVLGYSYDYNYSPNLVYKSELHILISLIKLFGFYYLYKAIFNYFYEKITTLNIKKHINKTIDKFFNHPYIYSFLILFIIYGIYLIIFYPGIINYDNANQIKEVLGLHTRYLDSIIVLNKNITLTNFNPIIHTLLLGGLFKFGVYLNNVNLGLFIYTFIQMLVFISCLSYTIKFLFKEGLNKKLILVILLIYIIIPYFPLYSITCVKDTYFSIFVLIYIIELYRYLKIDFKIKDYIKLIISMLLVILFRNNGIYLILLSFPFTLFIKEKKKREIIIISILIFSFNFLYGKILLYNEIPNTSIREMLSIPFQQTARYVKYHEEDVTKEESKIIDKILDYDTLGERYEEDLSDKVKNKYNKYATNEDLTNYFKVWFKMFFKHPLTYVNATVSNVYGYFYPNTYSWYVYTGLNEKLEEAGYNYHFIDNFEVGRNIITGYSYAFKNIPVIKLSVNCAFYTIAYIFLCLVLIINKKKKYIILLLPAFSLILMNIAGPANTYFRYVLPYAISLPLIISLIYIELKR